MNCFAFGLINPSCRLDFVPANGPVNPVNRPLVQPPDPRPPVDARFGIGEVSTPVPDTDTAVPLLAGDARAYWEQVLVESLQDQHEVAERFAAADSPRAAFARGSPCGLQARP